MKADGTPVKKNAFSEYMKLNYKGVKDEHGRTHKEIMGVLSDRYKAQK
jgi:hypothetical protein